MALVQRTQVSQTEVELKSRNRRRSLTNSSLSSPIPRLEFELKSLAELKSRKWYWSNARLEFVRLHFRLRDTANLERDEAALRIQGEVWRLQEGTDTAPDVLPRLSHGQGADEASVLNHSSFAQRSTPHQASIKRAAFWEYIGHCPP